MRTAAIAGLTNAVEGAKNRTGQKMKEKQQAVEAGRRKTTRIRREATRREEERLRRRREAVSYTRFISHDASEDRVRFKKKREQMDEVL